MLIFFRIQLGKRDFFLIKKGDYRFIGNSLQLAYQCFALHMFVECSL